MLTVFLLIICFLVESCGASRIILNIINFSKANEDFCKEGKTYSGLLKCITTFKMLPISVQKLIHDSYEAGFSPRSLGRLRDAMRSDSEAIHECSSQTGDLKIFHLCLLREMQMNPLHLKVLQCLEAYDDWIDFCPFSASALVAKSIFDFNIWSMESFHKRIMDSNNASLSTNFQECNAIMHTYFSATTALDSMDPNQDNREEEIRQFLINYRSLLNQVPLPLMDSPNLPSQLLPLIFRHYSRNVTHQRVIDGIVSNNQIWKNLDLSAIEPLLKEIDHPSFWQPWWNSFFSILWNQSTGTRKSLVYSVAAAMYAPDRLFPVIWNGLENHQYNEQYVFLLGKIKSIIAADIQESLAQHNSNNAPWGDYIKSCKWSLIDPATVDWKVVSLWGRLLPKVTMPLHSENILDHFFFNVFLANEFSLHWIVFFLHPKVHELHQAIVSELSLSGADLPGLPETMVKIWDQIYSIPSDQSHFYDELKAFLGIESVPLLGADLKSFIKDLEINILDSIRSLGGEDFSELQSAIFETLKPNRRHLLLDLLKSLISGDKSLPFWITINLSTAQDISNWENFTELVHQQFGVHVSKCESSLNVGEIEASLLQVAHKHAHYGAFLRRSSISDIKGLIRSLQQEPFVALSTLFNHKDVLSAGDWDKIANEITQHLGLKITKKSCLNTLKKEPYCNLLKNLNDPALTEDILKDILLDQAASFTIFLERNPSHADPDARENVDECAICMEPFTEKRPARALNACKHFFHRLCIKTALVKRESCPQCREPVPLPNK